MKHLHLLFVAAVVVSFLWRVYLAEKSPEKLAEKWLKILPHALAAGLLLSGIGLVFQGNWSGNYGWIVAKVFLMVVFIVLGIFTLKQQGRRRVNDDISVRVSMFKLMDKRFHFVR